MAAYRWTEYEKQYVLSQIDLFGTRTFFEHGHVSEKWIARMTELGYVQELAASIEWRKSGSWTGAATYELTDAGRKWAYENGLVSADGANEDKMYEARQAQAVNAERDYYPEYDNNDYPFESQAPAFTFQEVSAILDSLTVGQCRAFVCNYGRDEYIRWAIDMGLTERRMSGTLPYFADTPKGTAFRALIR